MYYASQKNRSFAINFLNIHFIAGEEKMSKAAETAQNPPLFSWPQSFLLEVLHAGFE